jgi:predicted nucleic acid-binding protein
MIILDTNVVSEPLKAQPDIEVVAWLDRQVPATLYLTTINIAELWAGIEMLPSGKRRARLQHSLVTEVLPLFAGRVLAFDQDCAGAFGHIAAKAQAAGNNIDFADCAIAAIAASRKFILATRNVKDFKGTGIDLLDPWAHAT